MQSANAGPTTAPIQIQEISYKGWPGAWRMSNGLVEVVVVPQIGRIMHFGPAGGPNLLWENPKAAGQTGVARDNAWPNHGGDKIWPWPQDQWDQRMGRGWPPPHALDQLAHHAEVVEGSALRLTSGIVPEYGVRLVRHLRLSPDRAQLTVLSDFVPAGPVRPAPASVWQITQVPRPQTMFARLLPPGDPQRSTALMIADAPWPTLRPLGGGVVLLGPPDDRAAKLGMEADLIAGVVGQHLLIQRLAPAQGAYEPNERAQLYTEPRSAAAPDRPAYVEFEFTAPRTAEPDGTSAPLSITWEILPIADPSPEAVARQLAAAH